MSSPISPVSDNPPDASYIQQKILHPSGQSVSTSSDLGHEIVSLAMGRLEGATQGRIAPEEEWPHIKDKLKNKKGHPWDTIQAIAHPLLIEQLLDLYTLIQQKKLDDSIMPLCLKIASIKQNEEASETLGKLIFLVGSSHAASTVKFLDINQIETSQKLIDSKFGKEIKVLKRVLKKLRAAHINSGIQDGEIACNIHTPMALSKLLISETGEVNVGLAPVLAKAFIKDQEHPKNHEINLLHALRKLVTSPALRAKIAAVQKPASPFSASNDVIRMALKIPLEEAVTDLDAKRVVLGTLLSHLRQGKEGSCFATPLAIYLLNSQLKKAVGDFTQLLHVAKLTKIHNDSYAEFPFVMHLGESNIDKFVTIDRKGLLRPDTQDGCLIWEVPGILAAANAIGLKNPQAVLRTILEKNFKHISSEQETLQLSLSSLLQELVKYPFHTIQGENTRVRDLFAKASFAFEAEECNPLLKVWENSISGMAEGDEDGMIKSAILSTVIPVLRSIMKKYTQDPSYLREMCLKIYQELNAKIHLQYDPSINGKQIATDHHTSEGAFILYDKSRYSRSKSWLRIDSPPLFQTLISRVVEEVKLPSKEIAEALLEFIETPEFIDQILIEYYPPNNLIVDRLYSPQKIKYAPWITKSGNNLKKVIEVYQEDPLKAECSQFTCRNGKELLASLIDFAKDHSQAFKDIYRRYPHKMIPVRVTDTHAFSLMLGHPSFIKAWDSPQNTVSWIEEHVLQPGSAIADTPMEKKSRAQLIRFCSERLIQQSKWGNFLKRAELISEGLSIKAFRQKLLFLANECKSDQFSSVIQLARELDTALFQCLPTAQKQALRQTSVTFADSNWAVGVHDLHFCLMVNPGTGSIEMWRAHGEEPALFALDQAVWVKDREWEIFTFKNV